MNRGLQSATILASSGGSGLDMSINAVSAPGDSVMEMKSQDLDINSTVASETRSPCMVKSWRGNWGHGSSQNSHPLTVCYASAKKKATAEGTN